MKISKISKSIKEKNENSEIFHEVSEEDLIKDSPEREAMFKKRRKYVNIVTGIILLVILTVLTIWVTPKVIEYSKPENEVYRQNLQNKITSMGPKGFFVLLGLQIVQVVLVIIPSEPLEIISGVMYGPWAGLAICLIGNTLGIMAVYGLIKLIGGDFVKSLIDLDKYKKKDLLNNPLRTETIMAGILLFPGLPKDFLAFLLPFTKVKLHRFLIINIIFRIPSILASTYFGNTLLSGDKKVGIILMVTQGIVAVLVFIFNKQISAIGQKIGSKKN